jgi:peptide/nickel transport system substrate-binding protein
MLSVRPSLRLTVASALTLGLIALTACSSETPEKPAQPTGSTASTTAPKPTTAPPAETSKPAETKTETAAADSDNPFAKYTEVPVVDAFNQDVKAGRATEPRRGGKLRVRSPSDFANLNPVIVTGQPERVVLNHMSDSLVDMDYFSFETYPVIAWYWREGDVIKLKDGEQQIGRILDNNGEEITFVPDGWLATYNRFDVIDGKELKSGDGSIKLSESKGGATITGRMLVLPHTVQVDTGYDPALADKKITIKLADLDTYVDSDSAAKKPEPFAKPHCAYEFYIRDGVTWHDGAPFSAEDIKFTYDVILNPETDCAPFRATYKDVQSVKVIADGKAIQIINGKPYFKAIDAFGFGIGSRLTLPKHIFKPEQYGNDTSGFAEMFNTHAFRKAPILTGPYKFKEWKEGNSMTMVRNEDYWANKLPEGAIPFWKVDQPYLDEITMVVINDKQAAVKELEKGSLDCDVDVEPDTWLQPDTQADAFTKIMTRAERSSFGYVYIGWNLKNPIFREKETRKALAMLIPRDEIARDLHDDLAERVNGPMYFKSPAYDPTVPFIDYDPEGAKRILRKAGWNDRDGDGILEKEIDGKVVPFRIRYMYHGARDYHQKMADVIKEKLGRGGIDVELRKLDWAIFSDTVRDKNFDAVRFAWSADMDPDMFPIWHSSQMIDKGDNFVSYSNPRVDQLCEMIRREFNPIKRWEMGREMHRIIYEDQPYCFLFNFQELYFFHRNFQGVKLYPSSYPHNFSEWFWAGDPPPSARSGALATAKGG